MRSDVLNKNSNAYDGKSRPTTIFDWNYITCGSPMFSHGQLTASSGPVVASGHRFGMRGSVSGIQYTDGIVGHIIKNGGTPSDGSIGTYAEDTPYLSTYATSEMTYDNLLGAFEVIYDRARGGSPNKLGLASLPVISHFNKLAGFVDNSFAGEGRYNFSKSDGQFGHSIMKIDTVHGSLALVKEPLFRGFANSMLALIDMKQVAYRPLVGNGLNRDTHIITNVQQADEDLRKDMVLTEAGLEVALPETHMLYNFEGV